RRPGGREVGWLHAEGETEESVTGRGQGRRRERVLGALEGEARQTGRLRLPEAGGGRDDPDGRVDGAKVGKDGSRFEGGRGIDELPAFGGIAGAREEAAGDGIPHVAHRVDHHERGYRDPV